MIVHVQRPRTDVAPTRADARARTVDSRRSLCVTSRHRPPARVQEAQSAAQRPALLRYGPGTDGPPAAILARCGVTPALSANRPGYDRPGGGHRAAVGRSGAFQRLADPALDAPHVQYRKCAPRDCLGSVRFIEVPEIPAWLARG